MNEQGDEKFAKEQQIHDKTTVLEAWGGVKGGGGGVVMDCLINL